MVQRLKINQFYGAPTAFRLLLKFEDSWVKKYDRSSLRTLGSGERLQEACVCQSQRRSLDGFITKAVSALSSRDALQPVESRCPTWKPLLGAHSR